MRDQLASLIRDVPNFPKPGILFYDITTLLSDAQGFRDTVDALAAPYMGEDSVKPFLEVADKWTILLGLTSNKGAFDFQFIKDINGKALYQNVMDISKAWGTPNNLMYVTGATKAAELKTIRTHLPEHFLLVPGVGAQGGSLQEVAKHGMNSKCGLLVNSSRGIIYASTGEDFAKKAGEAAKEVQLEMETLLNGAGLL